MVTKVGAGKTTNLIEFTRFTHDGHVTKIRTGAVGRIYAYVYQCG